MKRVLIAFVLGAISLVAIPAQAQSTYTKEAEIRAAVPYATMRAKVPGLTLADYNRAVRAVAEQELGIPSTPLAPTAPYSGTSTRIAGTTFQSFDNGVTGSQQRIGSTTFSNYSNGTTGTSTRLGRTRFHNYSNPYLYPRSVDGTSTQIGSTTFHNFSDGTSGTSTQIGGTTFHNFSNGTSCTSSTIGSSTFTNCY